MNNAVMDDYRLWLKKADQSLERELASMTETDIEEAFHCNLTFGTGGLRGVIGAGPNRMNIHTIEKATQGLSYYLNSHFDNPVVAIARDSRHMGDAFIQSVIDVLISNGISVRYYPRVEPTPALSFAIRDLGCCAGICLTASHNPAQYHGYKVYGPDGCQITTAVARDIQECIDKVPFFSGVKKGGYESNQLKSMATPIDDEVLDRFVNLAALSSFHEDISNIHVVYTPLHGVGWECASKAFALIGLDKVTAVPCQVVPDGDFPTCHYPNPEYLEALDEGLSLCRQTKADVLLATDPDADRVGVAVRHDDSYVVLTGNQIGMLLTNYLCEQVSGRGIDLSSKVVITTVVSGAMVDALAELWHFELRRTLTGFKYIGEQIGLLESESELDRFLFAFEESCGYLCGTHVRDKDAISSCVLICDMISWYKADGLDLVDVLQALYEKCGYYSDKLLSFDYPGVKGAADICEIMGSIRNNPPHIIVGKAVISIRDYLQPTNMPIINGAGERNQYLPNANLIEMLTEDGSKVLIRPSGTEPKIKIYLSARGSDATSVEKAIISLSNDIYRRFDPKYRAH